MKAAIFVLGLNKAHVRALNTAHVLRLNKADVLALNKAHVLLSGAAISGTTIDFLVLPARQLRIAILTRNADSCANWNGNVQFYLRILMFFIISKSFGLPGDMRIKQT